MSFTPTYIYQTDSTGQVWQGNINPDGSQSWTPIAGVPPSSPSTQFTTTSAGSIVNAVIQDAQVMSTNRVAVLDYVNRTCQRILRDTQWNFLRSSPQRFITQPGATQYYLGSSNPPAGAVSTGLNLSDIWSVWGESVYDRSHSKQLLMNSNSVMVPAGLSFPDGHWRAGQPRTFGYEINNPNVLGIYPLPDNQNTYQPVPQSPLCSSQALGSLPQRVYYVFATYVDNQGNESTLSTLPTVQELNTGYALIAQSPGPEVASASQVSYSSWNCYVGLTAGSALKQNSTPIALGSPFNESSAGQILNLNGPPTTNTLAPLVGYIIEFKYFRQRQPITSINNILQIPDYYQDVVIAGTNYYFNLYMDRDSGREKAMLWKKEFEDGIKQIRKDLNISFRNTDFISPDMATQGSQDLDVGYGYGSI